MEIYGASVRRAQYDMYPCDLAQGEVRIASTSTLKIDESPVTCGEPARRTDHIEQSHNARARDGVWDKNVVLNSGSAVRFDLRDFGNCWSFRVEGRRVGSFVDIWA